METPVKQRLIGALVLALIAIFFLPMLLKPDVKAPDVSEVPLDMPKAPESEFETHDLPLNVPSSKTPAGGVLGVPKAPADAVIQAPVIDTPSEAATPAPVATTPVVEPTIKQVDAPKPAEVKPAVAAPKPVVTEKPAETKPVETRPATVAAGNFTITVGSYSKLDSANALIARLKAQKLPVLTEKIEIDGKPAVKIRIGPYADRASAEAARLKADEIAGGASKVNVQDAAPVSAKDIRPVATTAKSGATPSSGFSVQLEALSDNAKAEELRNRARALGFNAFVKRVETEKGVLFNVRLGPVADREAANKLLEEAKVKLGKTGIIKTHP